MYNAIIRLEIQAPGMAYAKLAVSMESMLPLWSYVDECDSLYSPQSPVDPAQRIV